MRQLKRLIAILLVGVMPVAANAQGEKSIEKGDLLINPGITLGWYKYGYGLNAINILPPVSLNFEYAFSDYFSVGFEADYGRRRYQQLLFQPGGYEYDYIYKGFGLRGSFHYLDLLQELIGDDLGDFNLDNLDFYLGASYGITTVNTVSTWTDPITSQERQSKTFSANMSLGFMAGFRYYFSNSFGAFLETGRNRLGWAKLGLTFKI